MAGGSCGMRALTVTLREGMFSDDCLCPVPRSQAWSEAWQGQPALSPSVRKAELQNPGPALLSFVEQNWWDT